MEVETDVGLSRFTVPSSSKQVLTSPQRAQWEAADRRALEVLILAGNVLRPIEELKAENVRIFQPVMVRKLKYDKDTKKLSGMDPFKSRLCLAGDRQTAGRR